MKKNKNNDQKNVIKQNKKQAKKQGKNKPNQVGKQTKKQERKESFHKEWYYMNEKEITVSDIKEAFGEEKEFTIEVWCEAGVVEISKGVEIDIDIEQENPHFPDEYSEQFLKTHGVSSLYYVTVGKGASAEVSAIMKQMVSKLGGFFCADTDNFEPVIK